MSETIEVLAEAWASLDGKLEEFHTGRAGKDTEGHYLGYLSDAAELAKRLERRGYVIRARPARHVSAAGRGASKISAK
jgi:hypothetical protein